MARSPYVECVGDDLDMKVGVPFTRLPNIKKGETVVFSWICISQKRIGSASTRR